MIIDADSERFELYGRLQPALIDLYAEACAVLPHDDFCANRVFYGYPSYGRNGFKRRLMALVGWEASPGTHPHLCTTEAYDLVYSMIYHALPDCRHEGMCR
jgi:hypothetical protein